MTLPGRETRAPKVPGHWLRAAPHQLNPAALLHSQSSMQSFPAPAILLSRLLLLRVATAGAYVSCNQLHSLAKP